MLYVAMTFWLLVIVFLAWGVHQLWSGMIKPRTVTSILLPGTLLAQLRPVLGLLVTGATVSNTTLYKDDESGEPETTKDAKPRIPVVGPVIIGLLPLLACAVAIFFVARYLGTGMMNDLTQQSAAEALPRTLTGIWHLLRDQITLAENALDAALNADSSRWQSWLFIYLIICLTVRMAPFPGTMRGSLGAILLLGLGSWVCGLILPATADAIRSGWGVLSASVGALSFLLLASLAVRGVVSLIKLLAANK